MLSHLITRPKLNTDNFSNRQRTQHIHHNTSTLIAPLQPPPTPTLPLPRILHPPRNIPHPILHPGPCICQRISYWLSCRPCRASDGVTETTCCSTGHATNGSCEPADGVAEGGGDELGGAGCASVVVGHFGRLMMGG